MYQCGRSHNKELHNCATKFTVFCTSYYTCATQTTNGTTLNYRPYHTKLQIRTYVLYETTYYATLNYRQNYVNVHALYTKYVHKLCIVQ